MTDQRDLELRETETTRRDHAAERASWASGWFLSLMKARRLERHEEELRARRGLRALGINIEFDEDLVDPSDLVEKPHGC